MIGRAGATRWGQERKCVLCEADAGNTSAFGRITVRVRKPEKTSPNAIMESNELGLIYGKPRVPIASLTQCRSHLAAIHKQRVEPSIDRRDIGRALTTPIRLQDCDGSLNIASQPLNSLSGAITFFGLKAQFIPQPPDFFLMGRLFAG